MQKTRFPAVLSTFVLCFAFWILLTWSFEVQELAAGAVVSLAAALFASRFFIQEKAFRLVHPRRFFSLLVYVFVFLGEVIKANLDMARRCFGGCKDVNPGIVKVPVDLPDGYGEAMLANSITLTPGTITLDIVEEDGKDYYYIHWIDVAETDRVKAGEIIKGRMEKWIGRIWPLQADQGPHGRRPDGRRRRGGYADLLRDDPLLALQRERHLSGYCDRRRDARHHRHAAGRSFPRRKEVGRWRCGSLLMS